jgi:hypothetical protein
VARLRQRGKTRFEFNLREKQIVGVVRRDREDADTHAGERACERFENTGLGEIEGAEDAEAAKAALGFHVRRDGSFCTYDRELGLGACD